MLDKDKIVEIQAYVSERSVGLYDDLEQTTDEDERSLLIEQITIFDEIYNEINRIKSLE
jgi:hypothetical protein